MAEFLIVLAIVALAIGCLAGLSLRANARYRDHAALPMQWSLKGSVTWSAPRRMALSFLPILGTCVLLGAAVSTLFIEPRQGQEDAVVPAVLVLAAMFVGVHLFHLGLVARELRRTGQADRAGVEPGSS